MPALPLLLTLLFIGSIAKGEPDWSQSESAAELTRQARVSLRQASQTDRDRRAALKEEAEDLILLSKALDVLSPKPFMLIGIATPKIWQRTASLDAAVEIIEGACRKSGYHARLVGQRIIIDQGSDIAAVQLCAPDGSEIVNKRAFALLVARGDSPDIAGPISAGNAKTILSRLCAAQGGPESEIVGEAKILNGSGVNAVYALGACRYWAK